MNKTNNKLLGHNNNENTTISLNKDRKRNSTLAEKEKSKTKIGDKATTTSPGKMTPTTERAKVKAQIDGSPVIPQPASTRPIEAKNLTGKPSTVDKITPANGGAKFTAESPKNQPPMGPTASGNKSETSAFPKSTPELPSQKMTPVSQKQPLAVPSQNPRPVGSITAAPILPNPMLKLPIGLIGEKNIPTNDSSKPKIVSPAGNTTDEAIDNAWKIVKEKKYDNLDKKTLPKYEIPAADLAELEGVNGTATNTTDDPAILKEAVAKEVKEAMGKFEEKHQQQIEKSKSEQAEDEHAMGKWRIVALVLIPLFLVTFAVMLIIGIRQRMNVAKGRSVVYELTAELGKKNNEKPVVST